MKRRSKGFASWWLNGHRLKMERFLSQVYDYHDMGILRYFFKENPIQAKIILEDYETSNDVKIDMVIKCFHSGKGKLMYIIGAKGSGKTCTAFFFVEKENDLNPNRKICYIGRRFNPAVLPKFYNLNQEKVGCFWFEKLQDVPNGYLGIIDELGLQASAREFRKRGNIEMSQVLQLARQKDIPLIVLTQDTRLGEVNVWRLKDMIIWKKSNTYDLTDRESRDSASNKFWIKVRRLLAPKEVDQCLFEYPSEKKFIHFNHIPPSCWNEELSNIYKDTSFADVKQLKERVIDKAGFIVKKPKLNKKVIVIGE